MKKFFIILLVLTAFRLVASGDTEFATSTNSDLLFSEEIFNTYEITVEDDDWEFLNIDPIREEYVPATLKVGDQYVGKVGLRYKGNYGTLRNHVNDKGEITGRKLSMKIKVSEYDKDKRFYGLKRLNFHSSINSPSLMTDMLAYSTFRDMGIHTSRTNYCKLIVNGVDYGIFIFIEQIDGRFTDKNFDGGGNGNLYKGGWPSSDNFHNYDYACKTMKLGSNHDGLINFNKKLKAAKKDEMANIISEHWDVDYLMKFVLINDILNNYDGPTALWGWGDVGKMSFGNDNFYIYQEEDKDKFWPFAWDLDASLGDWRVFDAIPKWYEEPTNEEVYELYPDAYVKAPNHDLFFQGIANIKNDTGEYKELYNNKLKEILNGPFSKESVKSKLDSYNKRILDIGLTDKYDPSELLWEESIDRLKVRIDEQRDTILSLYSQLILKIVLLVK